MKTPVEIFDDWAEEAGLTRLDPIPPYISEATQDQIETFNRRIREVQRLFIPGRHIDFHLDYIDDGWCDAGAWIWGERINGTIQHEIGLVSLNRGFIQWPVEIFRRLFSHPLTFPDIGNPMSERIGQRHKDWIPRNFDRLRRRRERDGRSWIPLPPVDKDRADAAQICVDLVWNFLMWHEVIHIVHGHVGYLRKHYSYLDYQVVEAWADGKAISIVLKGLVNKTESSLFSAPRQKIIIWSVAMFVLFHLWRIRINPNSLRETHPPTGVRFAMAMHSAASDIATQHPEFWQAVYEGQIQAEKALILSGGKPLLRKHIANLYHPKVLEHLDRLAERFRDVVLPTIINEGLAFVELDNNSPTTSVAPPQPLPQTPP